MNTWLAWRSWWRSSERRLELLYMALYRGTRIGHHVFSIVGGCAVLSAFVLWWMPGARDTVAARLAPTVAAAVEAGPARLLSGHPLPTFGVADAREQDSAPQAGDMNLAFASISTVSEPKILRAGMSPISLAKQIPIQRVAAEARDNRTLTSHREQALVATYLARRYRVAQDAIGKVVKTAFQTGREIGLDPLLLLAVMAIESGFNPYAESGVGAQGLMQVMSSVHSEKFAYFGGTDAALQPLVNIQVGALVLKDCIARGGSLTDGLRFYVGATSPNDGGYGAKVLTERDRLRDIARGKVAAGVTLSSQSASPPAVAPAAVTQRIRATFNGAEPTEPAAKVLANNTELAASVAQVIMRHSAQESPSRTNAPPPQQESDQGA